MIAVKAGKTINETIADLYGKHQEWQAHQTWLGLPDADRRDQYGNLTADTAECPHAINAYIPIPNQHAEEWPELFHTNESMFQAALTANGGSGFSHGGHELSGNVTAHVHEYHSGEIIGDGSGQITKFPQEGADPNESYGLSNEFVSSAGWADMSGIRPWPVPPLKEYGEVPRNWIHNHQKYCQVRNWLALTELQLNNPILYHVAVWVFIGNQYSLVQEAHT